MTLSTGQTEECSPWSATEGLSTGSSRSQLPPFAACTARRHPLPHWLPPGAPSFHLCDTRQIVQTPSAAKVLAPGSTMLQSLSIHGNSSPLLGSPQLNPSRTARKEAHDRTVPCDCTTTAAMALWATLLEPMQ